MGIGYKGSLKGRPGPAHVRELSSRASEPCPDGTARNAPLTGPRCHDRTEYTNGLEPHKVPERSTQRNREWRARKKAE